MPTKEELQQQITEAEKAGVEGHKLIEQGRQIQHDATAKANELREQLQKLETDESNEL